MNIDWGALRSELAIWRAEHRTLPLWWRDDDAQKPTEQLSRLADLSNETGVPVHLAVVPDGATPDLACNLDPMFVPVVHGWAHKDHSLPFQKKAEFGPGCNKARASADLQAGLDQMETLFGSKFSMMFVPPWNRLDSALFPTLRDLGYTAVSTYLPRQSIEATPGLTRINTHIDPIDWRGSRGLVAPEVLVDQTVKLLSDRRNGIADNHEPLGYLTHHLVHVADIWEFSRQFIVEICEGPVTLFRHDKKDTE